VHYFSGGKRTIWIGGLRGGGFCLSSVVEADVLKMLSSSPARNATGELWRRPDGADTMSVGVPLLSSPCNATGELDREPKLPLRILV